MPIHDDHRSRVRERVRQEGLDSFTEVQLLELLLFYTIPRADTNEIAHRLLEQFGSLPNVLNASEKALSQVEGMGEKSAFFLHLLPQVVRYYQRAAGQNVKIASEPEVYIEYLRHQCAELRDETVYLLCMDAKGKILGCEKIGVGTVNSANAPMRRVLECAIRLNASITVLAHNHPSGVALPSRADVQVTHFVASVLQSIDVVLLDHVIVAGEDAVSLRASNLYDPADYMQK